MLNKVNVGSWLVEQSKTEKRGWFSKPVSAPPSPEKLLSDAEALEGQLVFIEGRGVQQIASVDPAERMIELCNGGAKLDLHQAAFHGAAVALKDGRNLGKIEIIKPQDTAPHWRDRGETPMLHGIVNALAGNRHVFPKRRTEVEKLGLEMPSNLRVPGDAMRLFTAELAFAAYSSEIEDVCVNLEAKGFKDVRVIARDDALVLLAVDPTESAVVCAFRCATKVHSTILVNDTRSITEGRLTMPRGMHRYVSRVKESVDAEVQSLLEKYPSAQLVGTGSSLGGGAAVQWLSRGIEDGTVDPDRVAQFVVHGATRGVGRERADELQEILGGRLDVCVARGDWLTTLAGAKKEHGKNITKLGTTPAPPTKSHGLAHSVSILRKNQRHKIATPAEQTAAYEAHNAAMTKRYPELGMIASDPDAFLDDCRARFAAQKAKTPDAPYSFDFTDHGMVFVKQMLEAVDNKIEQCKGELAALVAAGRKKDQAEIQDRKLGLQFLREVREELTETIDSGKLTYRQMVEQGYFVSHALSQREHDKLSVKQKWMLSVDRGMQGHKDFSISDAYSLYQRRKFSIFQAKSSVASFDRVEKAFEKAFFDPNKFQFAYIPTTLNLGRDIFIRLALHEIHLGGIAENPIAADGFLRPGYDFWLHDKRHASLIWGHRERYERDNNLSEDQIKTLRRQFDVWNLNLNKALEKAPEKIRRAVIFFMFNYHHERGILPVPSSFDDDAPKLFSSLQNPLFMGNLLFWTLSASGQAPKSMTLADSQQTIHKAWHWLQKFWLPKRSIEEEIIGKRLQNPTRPSTAKIREELVLED